ncbi:unnamed protein product, partial [Polarella glacialis]
MHPRIEGLDWSLQLILFVYIVGPAVSLLWSALSDQSSAGIGFLVDRRLGFSTEDERFEEHWQELSSFVSELFQGACGEESTTPKTSGRVSLGAADTSGRPPAKRWEEVSGDLGPAADRPDAENGTSQGEPGAAGSAVPSASAAASSSSPYAPGRQSSSFQEEQPTPASSSRPGRQRSSWSQVEEMIARLVDPVSGKVRVYREILSCVEDEEVLAVYPEKLVVPLVAKVKIFLTCGLEYLLHWRRQRREGAIILTNKRLIHISSHYAQYKRSVKIDMYTLGSTVKFVGLTPPRFQCCARPQGLLSVSSRIGNFDIHLLQMKRLRDAAQRLWQGFVLLQDAESVTLVELDDWASGIESGVEVEEDPDPNASFEDRQAVEEARFEAAALWGDDDDGCQAEEEPAAYASDVEQGAAAASAQVVTLNVNRAEQWGMVLADGERTLWGPVLFEEEVMRAFCPTRRGSIRNRKRPAALVTITDRRLVVIQYRSVGPMCCGGVLHRSPADCISTIPLKCILGFSVEETFSLQRAMIVKMLGKLCCRVLPLNADPPCNFEEDKVLELRRWLGNVALFFSVEKSNPKKPLMELWRCSRGL